MENNGSTFRYKDRVDNLRITLSEWIEYHDDPMVGIRELLMYVLDIASNKEVHIGESLLMNIRILGIKELTKEERTNIRSYGISSGIAKDFTTSTHTLTKEKRLEDNLCEEYNPQPDEGLKSLLHSKVKPSIINGTASKARTFTNNQLPTVSSTPDGIYDFYGVMCPIEFRKANDGKKKKDRSRHEESSDESDEEYSSKTMSGPYLKNVSRSIKKNSYSLSLNNISTPPAITKRKGPKQLSQQSRALTWKEGVPKTISNDKRAQLNHQIYCLRAPFGLLIYRSQSSVYYEFIERTKQCVSSTLERQNNFLNFQKDYEAKPIDEVEFMRVTRDLNKNCYL